VSLAVKNSASGGTVAAANLTGVNCPGFVELTIAGVRQFLGLSDTFSSQVVLHIAGIPAPPTQVAPVKTQ
jgi:hypothetical protein